MKGSNIKNDMQSGWRKSFLFILVSVLILATSCSNSDDPIDEPMLKGIITSYNDYGAAILDIIQISLMRSLPMPVP